MNVAHAVLVSLTIVVMIAVALWGPWPQPKAQDQSAATPNAIDIGFAQAMIQHHDQAVLMSQILLSGEGGRLSATARSIETSQLVQIGQMQGWLQLWGAPSLPASPTMDWMLTASSPLEPDVLSYLVACRSEQGMPGMASSADLQGLRDAQGLERERRYLSLMIRHHAAALPMARFAADNAALPAVRALAAQVAYHQSQEAERLMLMLQRHDGST